MGLTMEKKRVVFLLTYYVLCSMAQLLASDFGVCLDSIRSCVPRHLILAFLFLISFVNHVFSDVYKWSFPPKHRSTGLFVMINCRGFNVTHRVFGLI